MTGVTGPSITRFGPDAAFPDADEALVSRPRSVKCQQETLPPQTDRATSYVSQNLVSCRNKLYNKSTTNRNSGVTVDRFVVNSHDSSIVV